MEKNLLSKNKNLNIKAITFDLGGVLFKEGKTIAIEKLAKDKNYNKELVLNILRSPLSLELRAGNISDEYFWKEVQKQLPENYSAEIIKSYWYDGYVLDENIINLVKSLYGKYKLFIFSGNIESRVNHLENKYKFRKYFDLEIYSYEYHLNKPQKEFIEVLILKSGLSPEEIIYIDDGEDMITLAKDLGFNAIQYKEGEINVLKDSLAKFGVSI